MRITQFALTFLGSLSFVAVIPQPAQAFGFFLYSVPSLFGSNDPVVSGEFDFSNVDTSVVGTPTSPNMGLFEDVMADFRYKEVSVFNGQTLIDESLSKVNLKTTFLGNRLVYNFIDPARPSELIESSEESGPGPLALVVDFLTITGSSNGQFTTESKPLNVSGDNLKQFTTSLEFYDDIFIRDSTFVGGVADVIGNSADLETEVISIINDVPLALIVEISEDAQLTEEQRAIANSRLVDITQDASQPIPTPSLLPGLFLSACQFLKLRKTKLAKSDL